MRSAVLAGGTASRFAGGAKGLERVGGTRILDRVVEAVRSATGQLPLLIANADAARTWRDDLEVVPDALPGTGVLGGMYTAVTAAPGPVLVLAWDMPFVPAALLEALVHGADPYDAYLPESGGRRGIEPLCGVYGPPCARAIRDALAREDYRAIAFHDHVRVGTLRSNAVRRFGAPDYLFFNVNSAEDLSRAEGMWRDHG